MPNACKSERQGHSRRAFSLAELLVVIGIISLLLAILLPALRSARAQAMAAHCGSNIQQIGTALQQVHLEFEFYPMWDDNGETVRYTWIDVLIERGLLMSRNGYCVQDRQPDFLNEARAQAFGILYPRDRSRYGMDYSYGISVPLASGSWVAIGNSRDGLPRKLEYHERDPSRRILAADGNWSSIINLSGEALKHRVWNLPTQNDNTIAYRHENASANFLFQDGHVERARYQLASAESIDTISSFLWYPAESLFVGPTDQYQGNYYPAFPNDGVIPEELQPRYYTENGLWSHIPHK